MNGCCCLMGAAAGKEETDSSRSGRSTVENNMSACEACTVRFTVLKRRKNCSECARNYCTHCAPKIKTGSGRRCERCQFLVSGSFSRNDLQDYKAKEIRQFLTKRKVPVDNCREKADLIDVLMAFSNNSQYRLEQEQNERRKQLLQAQARENLRSPPPRPQPPPYNALYNQSSSTTETRDVNQPSQSAQTQSHVQTNVPLQDPTSSRDQEQSHDVTQTNTRDPLSGERQSGDASSEIPTSAETQAGTNQEEPMEFDNSWFAQGDNRRVRVEEEASAEDTPASTEHVREMPAPPMPPSTDLTQPTATSDSPVRKKMLLSDVTSEEAISSLTSRQLKELLERNFVDYKGCVEKHELVTRVTRLWKENQRNTEEAEKLNTEGEEVPTGSTDVCKICMDAVVDCVLLDCGHMLTCTTCGKQLAECPICRQYVVRVVHVFKS